MLGGNVVDQLLNEHGLTHAGAAEQTDLAALGVGGQQIDDFDARLKNVHHGTLVFKGGGLAMDGPFFLGLHRPLLIDGVTQDVEHPAQHAFAHGDGDGSAGSDDLHAAAQALAGGEHNAADGVAAHMLRYFHDLALTVQLDLQGLLDLGQAALVKGNVHNRSHDLYNGSLVFLHIVISLGLFTVRPGRRPPPR